MKIEYDKKTDALYIQLRQVMIDENVDIEEGVSVDLNSESHIVGIEVLHARKRLGTKSIADISIQGLPLEGITG